MPNLVRNHVRLARTVAAALPLCLALAACGRAPSHHATAGAVSSGSPSGAPRRAETAAASGNDAIIAAARADLEADHTVPHGAPVRGVTTWEQAMPGRVAVCGQIAPFSNETSAYVPFVSVMQTGDAHPVDRFVGLTTSDADRVYEALVGFCYDKGGPEPSIRPSAPPIPPVPGSPNIPTATSNEQSDAASPAGASNQSNVPGQSDAPGQANPSPPPSPPGDVPGGTEAGGTVTMAHDGNLHDHPQGATVGVLAAGTALRVFATAPGGWFEVGTGNAPEGWVHQSMLTR